MIDAISRRDFVVLTGSSAVLLSARGAARADSHADTADVSGIGGDPDVRHDTVPVVDDTDAHVWTDTAGRHRLEVAPFETIEGYVAFDSPTDTPLRITLEGFERGEGHDRIRAALGDTTLQRALVIAAKS